MKQLLYFITCATLFAFANANNGYSQGDVVLGSSSLKAGKVTGKIEALVVLIEFADRSAYFSRDQVDSFFNQVGYTKYHDNGSVHDYWAAVSQNRVDVHTNVSKAYYKAPKTFAYYDTDGGGHTSELLDSALNWLDKTGFDFSTLTVDTNKNIKALSFQFVGNSGDKGLWGHSSGHGRTFDGVNTASYQISELGTTEMHLGGICHEQGHMLFGWPDSYDTDATNGGSSGCGKFDLMAGGNSDYTGAPSGNPMPPNPYFRYLAGWNDLIPLNKYPNDTAIKIIANSWNTYVYRNPNRAGEMFIIEARKKPNRNVDMPGEGVLVWHIDSIIPHNKNQQHTELLHYKVSVVQADKAFQLESGSSGSNNGDANDYFKAGTYANVTYAHTCWWNGANSGLQLRNISAVADTMTASYGSTNRTDINIVSERSSGGVVAPLGLKYYTLNSSQQFVATPSVGFEVTDCIVDGLSQGDTTKYTFSSIAVPHTLKFVFSHKATALDNVLKKIDYKYYEGSWSSMPDFSKLTPKKIGTIGALSLAIPGRIGDNFGIRYSGYFYAPVNDEYTFYLKSDDGSRFLIGGTEIVANNCQDETTGKMNLKAGYHPFVVEYYEGQVSESLSLSWKGTTGLKKTFTGCVAFVPNSIAINEPETATMLVGSQEFKFTCPGASKIDVEVYNLSGVLIDKKALNTSDGFASMSNSNLKTGLYCIRVRAGNKTIINQKASIAH